MLSFSLRGFLFASGFKEATNKYNLSFFRVCYEGFDKCLGVAWTTLWGCVNKSLGLCGQVFGVSVDKSLDFASQGRCGGGAVAVCVTGAVANKWTSGLALTCAPGNTAQVI